MKNIFLLLGIFLTTISIFAQTTLVSYDLTSDGSGLDATYVDSRDFISVNTGTLVFSSTGARANGWAETNIQTDYFEITVKPETGYKLNITDIEFGERRSSTGILDYQVRWSTDDFATSTTIATVNVPDNESERTGDITSLNITVDDGDSIQIRWYAYNAEGTAGTWRINNATLKIKGSVLNSSSNNQDSKAAAPTTQIAATSIASTIQSSAAAVDVFKFKITDLGTSDGKPTKVTRIRIKKLSGSQLLDDWIKGFVLKDGATPVSIASIVEDGGAAFFDLNINSGDLDIADGTSKELTLGVYLEADVVDNSSFSFYIDADDNGFTSDNLGSGFDTDFGTDVNSSVITITVAATKLLFQTQPSTTPVSTIMSPRPMVAYVDADDNVDTDISGSSNNISLTTTGSFDGTATTSVDPVAGLSTFSNIIHSATATTIHLTATSSSSSYTSINSSNFNIIPTPTNPTVDSLYISEVSDATSFTSEFLELYNPSKSPIDLSSVTLVRMSSSGSVEYSVALSTLSGDLIIDSSAYLVISRGDNRTTFESNWASFPSNAGFLIGISNQLFFGSPLARRWRITYDDGSKAIITIDDTQTSKGGENNTSNQLSKGSWTTYAAPANSTPGYRNPNSFLPIELIGFEVEVKNDKVHLIWQTASEENNDYFTIERSLDAEHFEEIGRVIGAGNSNTMQSYNYTDSDVLLSQQLYYRLKQTDYDGQYTYSKTKVVSLVDNKFQLKKCFYHNGCIRLELNSNEHTSGIIEVYNINGQQLESSKLELGEGVQKYSIKVNNLPIGIYMIRVMTNSDIAVYKLLVE
ncbi:MAG: hypothetical protein DRI84_07090 [Bacteroidetes bacterium]|nr:MAG: hypothetical protein DRI84_07090 [Bacteroidota bacterium]